MKVLVAFFLILFLSVPLFFQTVKGAYQLEYSIEVHADGSAAWLIEHRFVKGEDEALFRQLSDLTYFSDTFVKSIKSLVNATMYETGRMNMIVENFVMTTSVSGSYNIVKYHFYWRGFAEAKDAQIKIGDVFKVENFFSYLYGSGEVYLSYPSRYTVESVFPPPPKQDDSVQMLEWFGTIDFGVGEPNIVLREKTSSGFIEAVLIISLLALTSGGSISLYYFRFRKRNVKRGLEPQMPEFPKKIGIEDDEEKVVNLLRAAGRSLYQSTIADHCKFSRSKTSKLLATMENKGKIKREEKGREKVVTLINEAKEC